MRILLGCSLTRRGLVYVYRSPHPPRAETEKGGTVIMHIIQKLDVTNAKYNLQNLYHYFRMDVKETNKKDFGSTC